MAAINNKNCFIMGVYFFVRRYIKIVIMIMRAINGKTRYQIMLNQRGRKVFFDDSGLAGVSALEDGA